MQALPTVDKRSGVCYTDKGKEIWTGEYFKINTIESEYRFIFIKTLLYDGKVKVMLRVRFGDRDSVIYNTSVYFKNRYEDSWLIDEFAKTVIKDIERSEVLDAHTIQSPVLGQIPPDKLSGGVKALILMKNEPGKIFNASNCGDNCAKWILKLGEEKNFTIALYHIMDFGKKEFNIRILNDRKLVVHNMKEFLNAADKYLKGAKV